MDIRLAWRSLPVFPILGVATYHATEGNLREVAIWLAMALFYESMIIPGFWSGVRSLLVKIFQRVRPYTRRAAVAADAGITRGGTVAAHYGTMAGKALWARFLLAPILWTGGVVGVLSILTFTKAYLEYDWERFHIGLGMVAVSAGLLVTHFDRWGDVSRFIRQHPVGVWFTASAVATMGAGGHLLLLWDTPVWWWATGCSTISLLCAIVSSIDKGWETLGKNIWSGLSFLGGFFIGKHGVGVGGAVIAWAVVCAVVSLFFVGRYSIDLAADEFEIFPMISAGLGGFVLLFFVGFSIVLMSSINKAMKK